VLVTVALAGRFKTLDIVSRSRNKQRRETRRALSLICKCTPQMRVVSGRERGRVFIMRPRFPLITGSPLGKLRAGEWRERILPSWEDRRMSNRF